MSIIIRAVFDVDGYPNGFYPSDVWPKGYPDDAIIITEAQYQELLSSNTRRWQNGEVVEAPPRPTPPLPEAFVNFGENATPAQFSLGLSDEKLRAIGLVIASWAKTEMMVDTMINVFKFFPDAQHVEDIKHASFANRAKQLKKLGSIVLPSEQSTNLEELVLQLLDIKDDREAIAHGYWQADFETDSATSSRINWKDAKASSQRLFQTSEMISLADQIHALHGQLFRILFSTLPALSSSPNK